MVDVIDSIDQFEDIKIDLNDVPVKPMDDTMTLDDIPSLDNLNLDAVEPEAKPKDELKAELAALPPSPKSSLDELELNLDDLDSPNEIKTIPVAAPVIPIPEKLEPAALPPIVDDPAVIALDNAAEDKPVLPTPIPTPILEPKKRGRKPKVQTPDVNTTEVVQNTKPLNGRWEPEFDLQQIKTTKYQTRHVDRTPAEVEELMSLIAAQGQLEPVHVHFENGEYQLMAGFGRVTAMRQMNLKSIKAIVYENLDQADITMISSGTNSGRLMLGDWDKIASLGLFSERHPDIGVTGDASKKTLTKVFGMSQATVYNYLNYYKYFNTKPDYINVLKTIRVPLYIIAGIYSERENIKNDEIFVGLMKNSYTLNKRSFESMLSSLVDEEKTKARIAKEELSVAGVDTPVASTEVPELDELEDLNTNNTNGQNENKERVEVILGKISKLLQETETLITELFVIENHKVYIKQDKMDFIQKRLNVITKMQLQLI